MTKKNLNVQSFVKYILPEILIAAQCYVKCFNQYADFKGLAARKEYWYFSLANSLMFLLLYQIGQGMDIKEGDALLTSLFSLVIFLPSLAVSVRRLHDAGKSGWWVLINLILIAGNIVSVFSRFTW